MKFFHGIQKPVLGWALDHHAKPNKFNNSRNPKKQSGGDSFLTKQMLGIVSYLRVFLFEPPSLGFFQEHVGVVCVGEVELEGDGFRGLVEPPG